MTRITTIFFVSNKIRRNQKVKSFQLLMIVLGRILAFELQDSWSMAEEVPCLNS